MKQKWFFIGLFSLLPFITLTGEAEAQGAEDEVFLQFRHQGVVNTYLSTIYHEDQFFISVAELFSALSIEHTIDSGRLRIDGTYPERGSFSLQFTEQVAVVGSVRTPFFPDDFVLTDFGYYLTSGLLAEAFGMQLTVNFSDLSLSLTTAETMPVVAQRQREVQRERMLRQQREIRREFYPLLESRNSSFLNLGFADYNLTTSYADQGASFNYNTNIGMELLGGDLQGSILGSYTQTASVFRTTNLRWRYGVVGNPWISILQAGQNRSGGLAPAAYTGVRLTNEPIEPRFLHGETTLSGSVFPNAEVELYRNNSLVDFARADASGFYSFNVPVTYGSSQYSIRSFSPGGLQEQRDLRFQIPQNFLPAGQFSYTLEGGRLDNPISGSLDRGMIGQGRLQYGVSGRMTLGAGAEYVEGFHDELPTFTGTLSTRLFTNHLVTLQTAHDSFYRASLQAIYPSSASISAEYTHFTQQGGIYNPGRNISQLRTNLFTPFQIGEFPLFFRWSFSQEEREFSTVYRYRVDLNTRLGPANLRIGFLDSQLNRMEFQTTQSARLSGAATYTFRSIRSRRSPLNGLFVRAQLNYIPAREQIEDAELQLSRRVGNVGRFQLSAGRNFIGDFNLIRFNFTLDFNTFRSSSAVRSTRLGTTGTQSVRGSLGYDSTNHRLLMTNRNQVGQAGVAVRLFVDNNNNGIFDEGDTLIPERAVRIERSSSRTQMRGGVNYISQLQAYRQYNLVVNKSAITNPLLVPITERFSFITDPNQYKPIDIPFYTSGIVEGMVYRVRYGRTEGLGGLRLYMVQVNTPEGTEPYREEIRTFSDGSFYQFEVPPGDYELYVDQSQLNFLNARPDPEILEFTVRALSEGDFVEGLVINLYSRDEDPVEEEIEVPDVADVMTQEQAAEESLAVAAVEEETAAEITRSETMLSEELVEENLSETAHQEEITEATEISESDVMEQQELRRGEIEETLTEMYPVESEQRMDIAIFQQDPQCRFSIQLSGYNSVEEAIRAATTIEALTDLPFELYSGGANRPFEIRTQREALFGTVLRNFNTLLSMAPQERPGIITQCNQFEKVRPLRFYIQLAVFSSEANAANFNSLLEGVDIPSVTDMIRNELYRVRAGLFENYRDLQRAWTVLEENELAPGMFIVVDPDSYSDLDFEYRLQAGVFSDPREAAMHAYQISSEFNVGTFVIINGNSLKVMINREYSGWDEVFNDFVMISTSDTATSPAIHLFARE